MCGIAGFSRSTPSSIRDGARLARLLALTIEHRGPDATGFAWTSEADPWPTFWKSPGRASDVAREAPLPIGTRSMLVHTRWATKGDPKDNRNNHPVVAPGIVLVHNGVVTNDDDLIATVGHERKAEVDSEALAALLALGPAALGADHPADVLSLVQGDAAIAWLDTDEVETLHVARLVGRPLFIAETRRGDFLFASTAEAIKKAAEWTGLTLDGPPVPVPEGTYLRVEAGRVVDRRSFPVPRRRPVATTAAASPRPVITAVPSKPGKPAALPQTSKGKRRSGRKHRSPFVPHDPTVKRDGVVSSRVTPIPLHGITDYFDREEW